MGIFQEMLPLLAERSVFSDVLLVVGLGMMTTWLMLRIRKKRVKARPVPPPSERVQRLRQERAMRGDLEDLMVEIEQLARRFSAQLDAKSIQLERLLREADARIQLMQRLSPTQSPPDLPSDHPTASPNIPSSTDPSSLAPIASVGSDTSAAASATPADDPLVAKVHDLADKGMDPIQIARALDEHLGKVELILALRETRP